MLHPNRLNLVTMIRLQEKYVSRKLQEHTSIKLHDFIRK